MDSTSITFSNQQELNRLLEDDHARHDNLLIQLFSDQTEQQVKEYYRLIVQKWPNSVVIGSSAKHKIDSGTIISQQTVAVVSQFDTVHFSTAVACFSSTERQAKQRLHQQLEITRHTKAVICFGDRLTATDDDLFAAFCHDTIPVAGGVTVTTDNGRWAMLNGEFYHSALVAVALHSEHLHVWHKAYNEWNPIGQTFVVTKVRGNRVFELNHQAIGQVYRRYLADGEQFPPEMLIGFPLMKGDPQDQALSTPISMLDDLSIEFDKPLQKGDKVRFCYDHPELTIQQVKQGAFHLAHQQPEAIWVYNCTSRLDFIEGNAELEPLQSVAGCYGFYCMGELYKDQLQQMILHHSMTLIAMREGEATQDIALPKVDESSTISPLFSMIRNSFADLENYNQVMQDKIESQANALVSSYRTDRRTGLPNRAVLLENIAQMALEDCLLNVKINNLTDINEKYGYSVGDNLLVMLTSFFAQLVKENLPEGAKLYSIGVGEWATVFTNPLPMQEVRRRFEVLLEQVESMDFKDLSFLDSTHLAVSISAGIAQKKSFLMCSADALLFKSIEARRHANKTNQSFVDADDLIQQETQRRERLEKLSITNHAIAQRNIEPYVQPIFDATTRTLSNYECLARLTHGSQVLSPGYFLPLVQGTRLYNKMSQLMIKRSFELMQPRSEKFSLNLSHQDIVNDTTLELLEESILGLQDPTRVGIEIVESEQIHDFERMSEVCNHFRQMGVTIIVDDFGSGYSNLDEIIKIEPDIIKLDGSLIRYIDVDAKQRKVASQLVRLCNVFGAKTVAEFVHNQAVCDIATELGVDYLQGFYLGEPTKLT
ncbi:EAL domain-containing protein [Vibrio sp. JPW-9-11-11]|uniref:bifunctional diguanylate cyclase/phosphodiesterase n=1 Tax=Vibrio sp. JPW-9-11-11 TaxID=1416532 RepID=UPI00159336B8|nr:EAL domain-containing protein [Vibrio sp. JPW-9-11-11]NVD06989.1 EAL domain-containing protein [Vibrio sp. JPW-9-11-11]